MVSQISSARFVDGVVCCCNSLDPCIESAVASFLPNCVSDCRQAQHTAGAIYHGELGTFIVDEVDPEAIPQVWPSPEGQERPTSLNLGDVVT